MTTLAVFDYVDGTVVPPWSVIQQPSAGGRFSTPLGVDVPGDGPYRPEAAMRVELRPYSATNPGSTSPADGDVTDTGGFLANRSEVYGRHPTPSTTAPSLWPDPAGSERWYGWSVYVPAGHVTAPDGTLWLNTVQWKGLHGGSPPLAMEINRDNWRLGGTKGGGSLPDIGTLGPINPGTWTNFVIGINHSPNPAVGWVEAWVNRELVLPRTTIATMDYQGDGVTPDPTYFKQGIYRNSNWDVTHVLHFAPAIIATSRLDFGLALSPPAVSGVTVGEHWGALV